MGVQYLENITEFLGNEEERYFSNGFKQIDCNYENLHYQNKLLTGEVIVDYKWDKKKTKHLHLGTVEYIAIASVVCEQILSTEFQLIPEEVSFCWINSFKIKIQTPVKLLDNAKIQVSGKLLSTEKISLLNEYKSSFEIKIDKTLAKISVIHSQNTKFNFFNSHTRVDKLSTYCIGYKKRKHLIEKITSNEDLMICTAAVSVENSNRNCQKIGIGSQYEGILLTDIVLIFGQLAQVLFYQIEKTDRNKGDNIWLKEIDISIDKPNEEMEYGAKLSFTSIKTLELKKEKQMWRSVQTFSELGDNISLSAKIISQIK